MSPEELEVFQDLLEDKGLPNWLAALVNQKEALHQWLYAYSHQTGCCECQPEDESNPADFHRRECELANVLRVLGGRSEISRQVEGAHMEAEISIGEEQRYREWVRSRQGVK